MSETEIRELPTEELELIASNLVAMSVFDIGHRCDSTLKTVQDELRLRRVLRTRFDIH